jgi:hypothetical protein
MQGKIELPSLEEEPGRTVELRVPMGPGARDRLLRELLRPAAVPRIAGQRHAGGRLLRESQGGPVSTRRGEAQNAGGAAASAHADAADRRMTAQTTEVGLQLEPRFVPLLLSRYRVLLRYASGQHDSDRPDSDAFLRGHPQVRLQWACSGPLFPGFELFLRASSLLSQRAPRRLHHRVPHHHQA